MNGIIYLIHFEDKVSDHALHYMGWTSHLSDRLARHRSGNGSRLMAEVTRLRLDWEVVRTWSGTRHLERQLKQRKNHKQLCPVCNKTSWAANAAQHHLEKPQTTKENDRS